MKNRQREIFIKRFVQSIIATLPELIIRRVARSYCGPEIPELIYATRQLPFFTFYSSIMEEGTRRAALGSVYPRIILGYMWTTMPKWTNLYIFHMEFDIEFCFVDANEARAKIGKKLSRERFGSIKQVPKGSLCQHFLSLHL